MTFGVDSLGKVRKANLRIGGITVVAGSNGTGKSTICKALMTWCTTIRRLSDMILDERMKSVRDEVNGVLKANELPTYDFFTCRERIQNLVMLKPESWQDETMIVQHLRHSWHAMFDTESRLHDLSGKIAGIHQKIVPIVRSVMERDSAEYVSTIFEDRFKVAFDGEYAPFVSGTRRSVVHSLSEQGRERSVEFEDGKVVSYVGVRENRAPLAFYLEPIHVLDICASTTIAKHGGPWTTFAEQKFGASDTDWRQVLLRSKDDSGWSLERRQKQSAIVAELERIVSVIHGSVKGSGDELSFFDADARRGVSLANVASGAKSMGLIEKGVREGVIEPGSLLIVDEPEANLHPEWQVEFARFLVNLNASFDMKIVINTHSPYFLRAINVFVRDLALAGRANYYNMVPAVGCAGEFETKDVTTGVEELFAAMYRPFESLA